ncbi:hypothetical protein Pcinc_029992 [Petrolisthes cinctipes]|uniref:RNase H type-1 domain-containing protein n=1 Tax=Petrolisthes cinctipes TaxID=88211 RepID=A0AAE1EYZ0_PETCI|nr:hypothetical protein Pcinc_029992 [Petrolisthes cinctipes]
MVESLPRTQLVYADKLQQPQPAAVPSTSGTLKKLPKFNRRQLVLSKSPFFLSPRQDDRAMAPLSSIPEGTLMPPPRPPDLHTPTTGVEVRMVERQLETSNKALATPRVASELKGRQSSHNRSQLSLQPHSRPILPHAQPQKSGGFPSSTSLDVNHRLEGCLPTCSHPTMFTQVSCFLFRIKTLFFPSSTVRSECGSTHLHPHSKMASFPPTPAGNQCHRLFRRLGHLGHFSRIDSKGCQHSDQPSEQPRLPHQHPKVPPDVEWLGIRWFPLLGRWALPEDKQMSILSSIRHVLSLKQVSRRQWEHILGKLNFATQILRHNQPLLQPLLRPKILSNHLHGDALKPLPPSLAKHLLPWLHPRALSISPHFHHSGNTIHLWTDASLSGWGGHTLSHQVSGTWDKNESTLHINCLEVRAVLLSIRSLNLSNCQLHLFIDNQAAQCAINKLRCKSTSLLHEISILNSLLNSRRILIHVFRISSLLNSRADNLSRPLNTSTEWSLPKQIFKQILTWRGPLEIDLMATCKNKKLPLYFSPHPDPKALASNALVQDWNRWNQIYLPSKVVTPSGAEETGILPSPRSDNSSLVTNGALVQLNTEQVNRPEATQDFVCFIKAFASVYLSVNQFIHFHQFACSSSQEIFKAWRRRGLKSIRLLVLNEADMTKLRKTEVYP